MDFKQGGQAIQRIRKERGMTQEQLAEKLNCNLSYLGNIERGKNTPSLKMFCKIVQTLNLSADDFIYPGHRSGSDSCLQLVQLLSQCTPREQLILLENARTLLENREEKLKK